MSDLTPDQLRAKYGMDNPLQADNPVANAALRAPELVGLMMNWYGGADGPGINQLFDPDQNPKLHTIATDAHREVLMAVGRGDVQMQDDLGAPVDINDDDNAVFVYFVGAPEVHVVRPHDFEVFASEMYRHNHLPKIKRAPAISCQVRVADVCRMTSPWRTVEFWPWLCGRYLLMFPVCPACRDRAIDTAVDGYKFREIAAFEQLAEQPEPAWARTAPWWLRARAALRRWLR